MLAVFSMAKKTAQVLGLEDGRGVKDGLLPWFTHRPALVQPSRPVQGVGDGGSAAVTVAEQLEGLSQHQCSHHDTEHGLRNRN